MAPMRVSIAQSSTCPWTERLSSVQGNPHPDGGFCTQQRDTSYADPCEEQDVKEFGGTHHGLELICKIRFKVRLFFLALLS